MGHQSGGRAVAASLGSAAPGASPQVVSCHWGLKQLLSETWRKLLLLQAPQLRQLGAPAGWGPALLARDMGQGGLCRERGSCLGKALSLLTK